MADRLGLRGPETPSAGCIPTRGSCRPRAPRPSNPRRAAAPGASRSFAPGPIARASCRKSRMCVSSDERSTIPRARARRPRPCWRSCVRNPLPRSEVSGGWQDHEKRTPSDGVPSLYRQAPLILRASGIIDQDQTDSIKIYPQVCLYLRHSRPWSADASERRAIALGN